MKYLTLTVALLLCASLTYAAPGKGKRNHKKKNANLRVEIPGEKTNHTGSKGG